MLRHKDLAADEVARQLVCTGVMAIGNELDAYRLVYRLFMNVAQPKGSVLSCLELCDDDRAMLVEAGVVKEKPGGSCGVIAMAR